MLTPRPLRKTKRNADSVSTAPLFFQLFHLSRLGCGGPPCPEAGPRKRNTSPRQSELRSGIALCRPPAPWRHKVLGFVSKLLFHGNGESVTFVTVVPQSHGGQKNGAAVTHG